jgi:hypothetical protein
MRNSQSALERYDLSRARPDGQFKWDVRACYPAYPTHGFNWSLYLEAAIAKLDDIRNLSGLTVCFQTTIWLAWQFGRLNRWHP